MRYFHFYPSLLVTLSQICLGIEIQQSVYEGFLVGGSQWGMLISWEMVSRPLEFGDLGICSLRLTMWCWRLFRWSLTLWHKVLVSRFLVVGL